MPQSVSGKTKGIERHSGESERFDDRLHAGDRDVIKSAANNGVCKHNIIMVIDEMKDIG